MSWFANHLAFHFNLPALWLQASPTTMKLALMMSFVILLIIDVELLRQFFASNHWNMCKVLQFNNTQELFLSQIVHVIQFRLTSHVCQQNQ
jgi:hypothetical protein